MNLPSHVFFANLPCHQSLPSGDLEEQEQCSNLDPCCRRRLENGPQYICIYIKLVSAIISWIMPDFSLKNNATSESEVKEDFSFDMRFYSLTSSVSCMQCRKCFKYNIPDLKEYWQLYSVLYTGIQNNPNCGSISDDLVQQC